MDNTEAAPARGRHRGAQRPLTDPRGPARRVTRIYPPCGGGLFHGLPPLPLHPLAFLRPRRPALVGLHLGGWDDQPETGADLAGSLAPGPTLLLCHEAHLLE